MIEWSQDICYMMTSHEPELLYKAVKVAINNYRSRRGNIFMNYQNTFMTLEPKQ